MTEPSLPLPTPHEDWLAVVLDEDQPATPCRTGGVELRHGDRCVVSTPDGEFLGRASAYAMPVVRGPRCAVRTVVRVATDDDCSRADEAARLEREIRQYARERATELGIDLRPAKVRLPLSGRRAVVYFTAEQRVDYRPLVRDLARRFRRRVEMRALGVRDGARAMGGIGPCGRCLCCATFMDRFHSVTVRMAKRQNLSLNPTKISGMCGRLMCCLAHEVDQYPSPRSPRG